ncbi:MAG: multiheme c-type cytochrome [Gammaproteobacteria bacterium]|nr:multiheme c-type cytochrome [Gammaproteobacteria bacterium]
MLFLRLLIVFTIGISTATADSWQLIYTSDLRGEFKPCGCSEKGNLGGVLRRASKLEVLRKNITDTVVVSAGDILAEADEQGLIKNRYLLQAYEKMGFDAIVPGERELDATIGIANQSGIPWVLSNAPGQSGLATSRIKILSTGQRVIILGIVQPGLPKTKLQEPKAAIESALYKLSLKPKDIVILLAHAEPSYLQGLGKLKQVDIIVRGHLLEPVATPEGRMKRPYILAAGHRGQRLGVAQFTLGVKPQLLHNRSIALSKAVPDHPALIALYQSYDKEVTHWYRQKSKRMKQAGAEASPYATVSSCQKCHGSVAQIWQKSRHAKAVQSLQQAGKDQDPECLVCHTTGMGKRGGFISRDINPQLENVQCEACHGAARKHAEYPGRYRAKNGFAACKSCHSKENSPDFTLSMYWQQIAHHKSFPIPLHRQDISPLLGSYELIDEFESLVAIEDTEVIEFFNFYCSRCYVLNANWKSVNRGQRKPLKHKEIPIIIGESQEPWAALAWIVAREHGLGDKVKDALFDARFEQKVDLGDKQAVVKVMQRFGIEKQVAQAIDDTKSKAWREYEQAQAERDKWNVHETPTVLINRKIKVTPKHSAENTNLMLENLQEILLDIQCRKDSNCGNGGD